MEVKNYVERSISHDVGYDEAASRFQLYIMEYRLNLTHYRVTTGLGRFPSEEIINFHILSRLHDMNDQFLRTFHKGLEEHDVWKHVMATFPNGLGFTFTLANMEKLRKEWDRVVAATSELQNFQLEYEEKVGSLCDRMKKTCVSCTVQMNSDIDIRF